MRTQLPEVCISAVIRREFAFRLVRTTRTGTASLVADEDRSTGVWPEKVMELWVVAVVFNSTGGVPSADVMERVVTPPLELGLMMSPSSGMSVFCWAARAVRPTYWLSPTSHVSRLGMDGKWVDVPPPRLLATACMKSILVLDFQTPLSQAQPAKLDQSLVGACLPALEAPMRWVAERPICAEAGRPANEAGRSRFSRGRSTEG